MRSLYVAVACFAVFLAGCENSPDDSRNGASGIPKSHLESLFEPVPVDPTRGAVIPFPFDGLFAGFSRPTLNIPNPLQAPFVNAANETDGFSTTDSIFTDLLGFVDFATVPRGMLIINTATGKPLVPGIDFTLANSAALDDAGAPGVLPGMPIEEVRTRILIQPLRPLAPSTRYLVALTDGIKDRDGNPAQASTEFQIVRSATPVAQQSGPLLTPGTEAVLSDAQKAQLEALRSQLIRPAVAALLAAVPTLKEENLALVWTFTTQSIGKTLQVVAAQAQPGPIAAAPTGVNTSVVGPGVPPIADIWAGIARLPYFLAAAANANDPAPLTQFWLADPAKPDVNATFLGLVPCGAFAIGAPLPGGVTAQPSTSTTACFPVPVKRSDQTVPLLVTVPNANSGHTKPANGWPVVIFQHGITQNRTNLLALAPALAAAGFVGVAIDLPLHGITDPRSPFFHNQLFTGTPAAGLITGERTFDLDLENNATRAPGPDGVTDPSGTWFINLASLLTSRDNLREAVADLIVLAKSAPLLNLDGDPNTSDIDASRIYFVGHSLGGIVGGVFLGVDNDVRAATLANPGGGLTRLLDGSVAFGPPIAAGLAASGVVEGTDLYETFLRFAQHITDPGDPINYAQAAASAHPIHLLEVCSDAVVPNRVVQSPAANLAPSDICDNPIQDRATAAGPLSGTDPLITALGLDVVERLLPPIATPDVRLDLDPNSLGLRIAVQFAAGDHGSVLNPAASLDVTLEMQREIANFLASDGRCLPIGGSCQ